MLDSNNAMLYDSTFRKSICIAKTMTNKNLIEVKDKESGEEIKSVGLDSTKEIIVWRYIIVRDCNRRDKITNV